MASWLLFAYCAFADNLATPVWQHGRNLFSNGADTTEVVPWQVHAFGCGGAIISPTIFLTVATCNTTFAVDEFVWAGLLDPYNGRLAQQRVVMEHIFDQQKLILHKNPVTGKDNYSSENDYMLVRIAPPWNFNSKVGKASLPTRSILGYSTSELEMTGWGMMDGGNYSLADTLQKATVTYVNCDDRHNGQFCAGGKKGGGSDVCHGDSGNPLVVKGTSTIVGIVTWGGDVDDVRDDCSAASTNGTKFTEVYQILDFINEALANDSDAQTPALLPLSANTSECNTIPQPDLANRTCKFPFESYGLWHTGCTNLFEYEKLGNLWCATGSDEWAYCSDSCPLSEYKYTHQHYQGERRQLSRRESKKKKSTLATKAYMVLSVALVFDWTFLLSIIGIEADQAEILADYIRQFIKLVTSVLDVAVGETLKGIGGILYFATEILKMLAKSSSENSTIHLVINGLKLLTKSLRNWRKGKAGKGKARKGRAGKGKKKKDDEINIALADEVESLTLSDVVQESWTTLNEITIDDQFREVLKHTQRIDARSSNTELKRFMRPIMKFLFQKRREGILGNYKLEISMLIATMDIVETHDHPLIDIHDEQAQMLRGKLQKLSNVAGEPPSADLCVLALNTLDASNTKAQYERACETIAGCVYEGPDDPSSSLASEGTCAPRGVSYELKGNTKCVTTLDGTEELMEPTYNSLINNCKARCTIHAECGGYSVSTLGETESVECFLWLEDPHTLRARADPDPDTDDVTWQCFVKRSTCLTYQCRGNRNDAQLNTRVCRDNVCDNAQCCAECKDDDAGLQKLRNWKESTCAGEASNCNHMFWGTTMKKYCRKSCGLCTPDDMTYGQKQTATPLQACVVGNSRVLCVKDTHCNNMATATGTGTTGGSAATDRCVAQSSKLANDATSDGTMILCFAQNGVELCKTGAKCDDTKTMGSACVGTRA
eukprot:GEMP01008827.1.p1 GENE.GEMP01008827.1~~GEMP01008827.1.p1  ORF type:complete len:945 (+),score=128.02 GEMP01008827.1:88-2922(+)